MVKLATSNKIAFSGYFDRGNCTDAVKEPENFPS